MMRVLLIGIVVALPAMAQTISANWAGAGAAWNTYASPEINGWASYAHLVAAKGQIYSVSSWDVSSARTRPWTAQSSARTGLGTILKEMGPAYLIGFADAGMATAGSNASGAYSGGGFLVWKLGGSDFTLVLGARVLRTGLSGTQKVFELGFGRTY